MRGILVSWAAVAAAAVALAFVSGPAAGAAPAASPQPYAACNGHLGVEYGTKIAYECLYAEKGGGILYWAVNKLAATYYFNPAGTGGMVAAESYFRTCAQDQSLFGAACPLGLPLLPQSNGRLITLADGCLVAAPDQAVVPTICTSTSQGGQPGETHAMTTAEQATVAAFYKIMHAAVPLSQW
jgi:hypothetical protein